MTMLKGHGDAKILHYLSETSMPNWLMAKERLDLDLVETIIMTLSSLSFQFQLLLRQGHQRPQKAQPTHLSNSLEIGNCLLTKMVVSSHTLIFRIFTNSGKNISKCSSKMTFKKELFQIFSKKINEYTLAKSFRM